MKRITGCAVLALCGCVGGQPFAVSPSSDPVRYEARGVGWALTIANRTVKLRERAGSASFDYHGPLPERQAVAGGIRFEGQLLRHYVIAGLAEDDLRPYALTILDKPCADRSGRIWATSVAFDFGSEYRPTGCGSALPKFASHAAVEAAPAR
jgi:hypothetical protein